MPEGNQSDPWPQSEFSVTVLLLTPRHVTGVLSLPDGHRSVTTATGQEAVTGTAVCQARPLPQTRRHRLSAHLSQAWVGRAAPTAAPRPVFWPQTCQLCQRGRVPAASASR